MSRSVISIHKEIEKEQHKKSPLGQVEAELGSIYNDLKAKNHVLPEVIAKQVYEIRDESEKAILAYIERTNREHKEANDAMLLSAMKRELKVLKKHLKI